MKTMYYQTSHFISHTDNLVDLGEYRSKLEQVQRDSLARRFGLSMGQVKSKLHRMRGRLKLELEREGVAV